ncbi:hypothetical protein ACCO45_001895 [Purpureocillium lilacinum]|uniref:Uncharacterized protein n=1 Tax=Purpureocillium lilacinum TaxID=33203 RepID=A0ACC4E8B0_PURLI
MFDFLTTREDPWRRKAFTRRGASWRTMLLAKFPITKVIFRTKFSVYRSQRGDTSRRNEDVLDFPNGLRMGQLFDLFFSMLYVEPVVGWHDAHVVWRIPRTHLGKPGCKCDEGGKRHEKKRTPSSTQSWDLLVDETYYHIAGPARNEAGRRAARTQEQCKDKGLVWGVFVSELAPNGFLGVKISSTALLRLARPWKTGGGWWRRNSTGSVSARTPWRVEPYWRYLGGREVQGQCTGSSVATQLQSSGVPSPKIEVHVRSSVRSTSMLSRSMSLEGDVR